MKTKNLVALSAAFAASCLLPSPSARAESAGKTYSDTVQSQVVRSAISAMSRGDFESFRASLGGQALDSLGTPDAMMLLRHRFLRGASGTTSIETHSDTRPAAGPDSFVLLSSHTFSVDVLGRRDGGALAPIWNVKVECLTLSLTASFGGPDARCRISELSADARTREGQAEGQRAPAIYTHGGGKDLGGAGPQESSPGSAGSAR